MYLERTSNLNKWTKELQVYNNELWDRVINLERYSHEFNLRFYNVPEKRSEECIPKIKNIIKNDLNLDVIIENAHRIGKARKASQGQSSPNFCTGQISEGSW